MSLRRNSFMDTPHRHGGELADPEVWSNADYPASRRRSTATARPSIGQSRSIGKED
jgi:hypothetical protein